MNMFAVNKIIRYNGVFAITKTPNNNNDTNIFFSVPWHFVIAGCHCTNMLSLIWNYVKTIINVFLDRWSLLTIIRHSLYHKIAKLRLLNFWSTLNRGKDIDNWPLNRDYRLMGVLFTLFYHLPGL